MINVFVWPSVKNAEGRKENVGHAAMSVNNNTYISWWPDEAAGITGSFSPQRNKSFESDMIDEGNRSPLCIPITSGLDENAILDWWRGFGLVHDGALLQGPMLPYQLITQNCSTVVAMALRIGGGDKFASVWAAHSLIWRPSTVLSYASSIKLGVDRHQKKAML